MTRFIYDQFSNDVNSEDREIIMRLAPLYQEDRARAIQEGRQGEGLSLILRQLNRRIGSLSPDLKQRVRELPLNTLEDLGEALLDFETDVFVLYFCENP